LTPFSSAANTNTTIAIGPTTKKKILMTNDEKKMHAKSKSVADVFHMSPIHSHMSDAIHRDLNLALPRRVAIKPQHHNLSLSTNTSHDRKDFLLPTRTRVKGPMILLSHHGVACVSDCGWLLCHNLGLSQRFEIRNLLPPCGFLYCRH
jgi:hypothetical protein